MSETKYKVGDKVSIGGRTLEISKIDAFGRTPHYGFFWEREGQFSYEAGWMPVEILDAIAP